MTDKDRHIFWASGYGLLVLSTVLALTVPIAGQPPAVVLALAGATAIALAFARQGVPRWPIPYYVVLVALIVAMQWANSMLSIFGAVGYGLAFALLPPRWIAVGVAAQT